MSFENINNETMPTNENLSGKGKGYPIPDGVKKFNWGAFALDWIWGLGNESYITLISLPFWFLCFIPKLCLLSCVISIVLSVWFGIKGNEWAWQNKQFDSIDSFHSFEKKWAIAGSIYIILLFIIPILLIGFIVILVALSGTPAQ